MHRKHQFYGFKLLNTVDALDATLGEIAYASAGDWNNTPNLHRAAMWRAYDEVFGVRCDYRLWRQEFRNRFYPSDKVAPVSTLVASGLEGSEVVVWGTLCSVAGILGAGKKGKYPDNVVSEVASLCSKRMAGRALSPPLGTVHGCAAIRLCVESGIDRAWYSTANQPLHSNIELRNNILDNVERLVCQLDSQWRPGRTVALDSIYRPPAKRKAREPIDCAIADSRPVLTFDQFVLARYIRNVFFRASFVGSHATQSIVVDDNAIALFQRGYYFAMSAWLSARSLRIAEEQRLADDPDWHAKIPLGDLYREEMQALRRVIGAAGEAGRHATVACLCHHMLATIPDGWDEPDWDWFDPDELAYHIRQLGLEVPERFVRARKPRFPHLRGTACGSVQDAKHPSVSEDNGGSNDRQKDPAAACVPDAIRDRLAKEQSVSDWWEHILRTTPASKDRDVPTRLLGYFVTCAQLGKIQDADALIAGLRLCVRKYNRLADARRLLDLKCFPALSRDDALFYAEAISLASTLRPWAIDSAAHRQWQGILRRIWGESEWDTRRVDEEMFVHETLLGRLLPTIRDAGSQQLARKLYNRMPEEEIVRSYDHLGEARARGASTTDITSTQRALAALGDGELGKPVALSVVWLGQERWGILAVAANGQCCYSREHLPGSPHSEMKEILATPELHLGVPWGNAFLTLGDRIAEVAKQADPMSKWMMLALEPNLAKLPWQNLIGTRFAVSLVPSLTWVVVAQNHPSGYEPSPALVVSSQAQLMAPHGAVIEPTARKRLAKEYEDLRSSVQQTRQFLTAGSASVAVVVGHGTWNAEDKITSVIAPELPIGWDQWMEIAMRRVVIVHACSAGRVAHQFIGDISGLPAIALGQKCHLFAAPTSEVQASTATSLHRALLAKGNESIGSRYLRAIDEDNSVNLYNLWGFLNERL